ncbi:tRNA pseudouridine(38-40) synthase TruA [Croceibacter atlanticus]|nr:tRNA pseudouridine synthase A [Croceibacter atlanticus]MBW4971040.1 tRNA pseudouridine(38-40) synthase TruA [Croceibacter atlanticus]WSP35820.1 tRNA pseudouridine synthase A [Croceibacter atlanticus]
MQRLRYYYIIQLQYLGFRFHGWQKQPDVNTVERMVERTLAYVLGHKKFKLLASGRTDAKVSVNNTFVELFIDDKPLEVDSFFKDFNVNLPQDIKALSIKETDANFNIIQHPKLKEYIYLFTYGEKMHPFCAPYMVCYNKPLNIELMQEAAALFQGEHDFKNYTYKPTEDTQTIGVIDACELSENTVYTANFFPEKSYMLKVVGQGFKRHQIRLMMGALFDLGSGEFDMQFFKKTLTSTEFIKLTHIAQASGLILQSVTLK